MNTQQKYPKDILKEIKQFFEQEKERLNLRLKQIDGTDPFKDPDHVTDNADVTTDVREEIVHEQTTANKDSIVKKIDDVNEALKRIEEGNFGYCKKCGKLIDTDRLSSNPFASVCIDCAKE